MEKRKYKQYIIAWGIDVFLWGYLFIICYKIGWQNFILNLRYPTFSWNQPIYCFLLGVCVSTLFIFTSFSLGKSSQKLLPKDDSPLLKKPLTWLAITLTLATCITSIELTHFSFYEFFSPAGLQGAGRIFNALINPNWAIFNVGLFSVIETIYMAFLATILAIPIAFFLSFFAARNLMEQSNWTLIVYGLIRFILNITRSVEPLVWAIIYSVWVGIGPFSGMLALWIHSIASLGKLYSEQIENIEDGPMEAMKAVGAHPIQVVWYGVVPQVVLPFLSFTIYRWDINIRMATIIGMVGGGGIGTLLMQYQGLAKWREVGMLVIIIATIVWLMDWASSKIRSAIR